MKPLGRFGGTATRGLLFGGAAVEDALELKEGRVLQGRYLGGTAAVLRLEQHGNVETFNVNDVVALTFTRNSGAVEAPPPPPAPAPAYAPAPVAQAQPLPAGGNATIPAGQSILVRMIDGVHSSKNHVGDIL